MSRKRIPVMNTAYLIALFGLSMAVLYTVYDIFSRKKIRRLEKEAKDFRSGKLREPSSPLG
jgi:hypothetical protein